MAQAVLFVVLVVGSCPCTCPPSLLSPSSSSTVMHGGQCPRVKEDELPEALSTINKTRKNNEGKNNTRSRGALRVLLWVVC